MDTTNDIIGQITDNFMFQVHERIKKKGADKLSTDQHNAVFEAMYEWARRITTKEPDEPDFDAQLAAKDKVVEAARKMFAAKNDFYVEPAIDRLGQALDAHDKGKK